MLKLPVYLRKNTYYFHTRIGGKQFKKSLGTSNSLTAKLRAVEFLRVIEMNKPTLGDFGFDSAALSKYELDLARGIAKATDPEDHKRMLQTIKAMAKASHSSKPIEPVAPSPADGDHTLLTLVDFFFSLKSTLDPVTKTDYTATAKELSDLLGNPLIGDITSASITRYMKALADKGNKPRTIDKKVGAIRALLNFAKKHSLLMQANPAADRNLLTKKQKKGSGSKHFDLADVQNLFDNPQFANYKNSEPAFYWIMIAGLLTGVRVSALAAVQKPAFKISPEGTHYIFIPDDKTDAGRRPVPIPKEFFVPLFGFIQSNKGFGFTARDDGKGSSDSVRKLLNAHKQAIDYVGDKQTFHGFRKTLNTFLMHKQVSFEARCQFMGHEIDHVNVNVYGKNYPLEDLAAMIVPHQQALLKLIKF